MTTEPTPSPNAARLERTYDAPAELIWELLTTAAGLEEWWAPDGFESRVNGLELRPGGQLRRAADDHIDIEPAGDRTNVVMTVDPLHDETWTQGYRAHRGNELDNLEAAIRRRTK